MSISSPKRDPKIVSDIKTYGWHVAAVGVSGEATFAYTIGLQKSYKHPELIILGLEHKISHPILNTAGDLIKNGATFKSNQQSNEILESFPCLFLAVPDKEIENYFGQALRFYSKQHFSALQVIWPDEQNHWPWQAGIETEFTEIQPVLGNIHAG